MTAGNGAAMRVAPLAFHLDPENHKHPQIVRDVCRITHHNDEAYSGALAVIVAVRHVAMNQSLDPVELFQSIRSTLPDTSVRDRIAELSNLFPDVSVGEVAKRFGCSGYVVESVPLALYAACSISSLPFRDVLRDAIECGGDTDTIASIAGQIAGTCIGASGIPHELITSLPTIEEIQMVASQFADTVRSFE